ncbi:MAG: response regulator, partial [Actinomycetota bacterium]|nr:response regulator [Actinomycetota bacterium]
RAVTPSTLHATTHAPRSTPVAARSRGRLLVVEDNAINQEVAKGMVAKLGYACDVAADGIEALDALERRRYDAVLMDCHMPRMDGYQATAEIRRREAGRHHVPILALTASALVEDREKCMAAGMDDYLAKPVKHRELEDMLNRWLSGADATSERADAGASPPPAVSDGVLEMVQFDSLREVAAGSGEPAFLSRLVDRFLDGASSRLAELQEAARRGDPASLEEAAHSLKGTSATMGATVLSSMCAALEAAAGRGEVAESEALEQVSVELERAAAALRTYVPEDGRAEENRAPGSDDTRG